MLLRLLGPTLIFGALFVLLNATQAFAYPEDSLLTDFDTVISPYFATGSQGEFQGVDGVPIRYRVFPNSQEKGALVIFTGRSEFVPKYAETIYDLRQAGYSIYIMDHRGQGTSGRMLPDTQKGYVKKYRDYLSDMDTFVSQVVNAKPHQSVYLMAHSMGSAIATEYAMEHPDAFKAMVLVSPMYEVVSSPYTETEALIISTLASFFGNGSGYTPGRGDNEWKGDFKSNDVTFSQARYLLPQSMLAADTAMALGGPTYLWGKEAIELDRKIRSHAEELTTPSLIFQAGVDKIVITSAQNDVCSRAVDCKLILMPEGMHELLMEKDATRSVVLSDALDFLENHK
jgi:lysophospholipase